MQDIIWTELMTRDSEAASDFFKALFGWQMTPPPLHPEYTIFTNEGKKLGGIMKMGEEFPDALPPHWIPCIEVADVDATIAEAQKLGGTICTAPFDIPDVGRYALITEPSGSVFSILKLFDKHLQQKQAS